MASRTYSPYRVWRGHPSVEKVLTEFGLPTRRENRFASLGGSRIRLA